MVGCTRPLLDESKRDLQQVLFESDKLHEPEKFKVWLKNAIENQRCVWGAHQVSDLDLNSEVKENNAIVLN